MKQKYRDFLQEGQGQQTQSASHCLGGRPKSEGQWADNVGGQGFKVSVKEGVKTKDLKQFLSNVTETPRNIDGRKRES